MDSGDSPPGTNSLSTAMSELNRTSEGIARRTRRPLLMSIIDPRSNGSIIAAGSFEADQCHRLDQRHQGRVSRIRMTRGPRRRCGRWWPVSRLRESVAYQLRFRRQLIAVSESITTRIRLSSTSNTKAQAATVSGPNAGAEPRGFSFVSDLDAAGRVRKMFANSPVVSWLRVRVRHSRKLQHHDHDGSTTRSCRYHRLPQIVDRSLPARLR